MRALNLDQLRALVTVAECGSFSAAARRLNLTQPAVSQQIRELEARVGVELIERTGKRARPSPAGEELLVQARDLLGRADDAIQAMDRWREGRMGRVRLGADGTLCAFVLPPVLLDLRRAHPDLELAIEAGPSDALVRKVVTNDLDLAMVTAPGHLDPALDAEEILDNRLLAFWPETLGPAPDVVRPMDLDGRPFVAFTPGNVTEALVQRWLDAGGSRPGPLLAFDMGVTIASIVAAGLGASILAPEVRPQAERFGSVAIRPVDPPILRRVVAVTRRDKPRTRALAAVRAALSALAGRE